MALSKFDKKERHKKRRRKFKYSVAMFRQNEIAMIDHKEGKLGSEIADSSGNRTGNTGRS